MTVLAAGCSSGGHTSSPTTQVTPSTTLPPTSSTAPGPQTSGSRTVLSPTGLNVRGAPGASAPVVGSAAQGTVLTVLGYTADAGGWFKVKGATVTGWITAQPSLSAPCECHTYSSSAFSALYPADWSESALGPAPAATPSTRSPDTTTPPGSSAAGTPVTPSSVAFRPGLGTGDIVVASTGSVAQLPHGRSGYSRTSVTQVVVCGVTAGLRVFQRTAGTTSASGTSVPESLATA